jgi:hypothetical protein
VLAVSHETLDSAIYNTYMYIYIIQLLENSAMLSNSTQSFSKRIMRSMISMGLLVHTGLSNFHLADLAGLGKP